MGNSPAQCGIPIAMVQAQNSRQPKDEACFQLAGLTAAKLPKRQETEV